MEVFLAILLALTILTVVGHALWVFARAILRIALGKPPFGDTRDQVKCGHCGRWTHESCRRCDICGRELRSPIKVELEDLDAVERQLERFEADKALDAQTTAALHQALRERRQHLRRPSPPKVPERPVMSAATPQAAPERPQQQEPIVLAEAVREVEIPGGDAPAARETAAAAAQSPPATPVIAPPKPAPQPKLPPPVPPRPPRQPLLETIAEFLEKRNIEWAELVVVLISGLLIVGASVALVINFWGTLQEIPWLKFAIFVVYSSGIFGVGLLCHRRWKLETIGRGLLWIAMLLVPLNFLAMAGLSRESWDWIRLVLELVSLGVFGWLVYLAARALVPDGRWLQAVGVVGNSGAVLLVARASEMGAAGWTLTLVGLIPVGVFLAATGIYLVRRSGAALTRVQADAMFALVGTAAFALAGSLGLLVQKAVQLEGLAAALDHSSLLVVLAAFPILAVGLAVMRGTTGDTNLAVYRTAGTATALSGMVLMLAAVAMAWPNPLALVLVGTIAAAALVTVALRYELPVAHAGAIAAAAVVYATGYHVAAGNVSLVDAAAGRSLIQAVIGPQMGAALVGLVALLAIAGQWLRRLGRHQDTPYYLGGCGITAAISLFLVTKHAMLGTATDMSIAAIAYAVYGLGALVLAGATRKTPLSYLGSGLVGGAALWGAQALASCAAHVIHQPWLMGLLAHATVVGAATILLRWWLQKGGGRLAASGDLRSGLSTGSGDPRRTELGDPRRTEVAGSGDPRRTEDLQRVLIGPLSETALVSSGLAVPVLAWSDWSQTLWMAGCLWWLAAIWLVIAWMNRWPALVAGCQAAMAVATVTTTTAWLEHHPFNPATPVDLTDPRCWQVYGIGLWRF